MQTSLTPWRPPSGPVRNPNRFNTLGRFWSLADFALCCGLRRVGRNTLVGPLL